MIRSGDYHESEQSWARGIAELWKTSDPCWRHDTEKGKCPVGGSWLQVARSRCVDTHALSVALSKVHCRLRLHSSQLQGTKIARQSPYEQDEAQSCTSFFYISVHEPPRRSLSEGPNKLFSAQAFVHSHNSQEAVAGDGQTEALPGPWTRFA